MAMKKRHHSSMKMKMSEHKVDKLHYRQGLGSEYYAGSDPRRRLEREDGAMIREDRNAVANLPQEVIYHAWEKTPHYANYELDDTIHGIDRQESEDGSEMMKHLQPGKY
jgi:hypothetical protein